MIAVILFIDQNKSIHNISFLGTYSIHDSSHLFIDQNKSTHGTYNIHDAVIYSLIKTNPSIDTSSLATKLN